MTFLRYMDDDGHLQTKPLLSDSIIIGRAATCQLVLIGDMISREHVRIDPVADGRYQIRDLGARNKTYVSGHLVTETLLSPGDIIRVGDRLVEFLDDRVSHDKINLDFLTPDRNEPPDCEWIKTKAPLTLSVLQLEGLAGIYGSVNQTSRPEDIAGSALGQVMIHLNAERGFIAWRGEGKRDLYPVAHRSLMKPTTGSLIPVSQSFAYAALLQAVAGRYPTSSGKIDLKLGYASTALVAPLSYRGEVKGIIYLDRPASKKAFSGAAVPAVAAAGAQLGSLMVEASRKLAESGAVEEAAWMSTSRRMQALLSGEVKGNETFDVRAVTFPGRARCGDFCDIVHLDDHRLAVVVIDAGGQGVSGVAQAASMRAAIRSALAVSEDALMDPVAMFGALNREVAASSARQAVPCTFLGIDAATGRAAYVCAGGMPPLLMVAPGRMVTLDQPSLVLGVDPQHTYETTRVDLPEVFRLVCYTDGLAEGCGAGGEPLGHERLHEMLLTQEAFESVERIHEVIANAWTTHMGGTEPDDDASMLVVGRGSRVQQ